ADVGVHALGGGVRLGSLRVHAAGGDQEQQGAEQGRDERTGRAGSRGLGHGLDSWCGVRGQWRQL
ncbi:hypothetical protein, partial [Klebsiella pneumoniae]|uniref:hypothetical protein n=1 Tax=Klebsiella pneumoniae TaxID=573 RepID=UPI003D35D653